jgi:glucose-1-phosphate adenylyltransferase
MQDTSVGEGCRVEYSIIDKQCDLGAGSMIGMGSGAVANRRFPGVLDCGITVVGKGVVIPAEVRVGKNCIIYPGVNLARRRLQTVEEGETVMA